MKRVRPPREPGNNPPTFCVCAVSDPCCRWCFRCVTCGRLIYHSALEAAYAQGTRHPGDYQWGDGGYADEPATVPSPGLQMWTASAHP